jgi:hypothetical protein
MVCHSERLHREESASWFVIPSGFIARNLLPLLFFSEQWIAISKSLSIGKSGKSTYLRQTKEI